STPSPNRMERALSIPSWPASNGPVYSTKTRMPPRRGRSPAKFSTTGTPSPPSSPIPICRPPTTMPRQHSGMRSSQGGSASEREPRKGRALMRPSSASLKPAGGERSMRGVSSQKPSGMPGEANRQRPSRHLPNPGKVNGYLHGSVQRIENVPNGMIDQNVFDIRPGVAIALLVKNRKISNSIEHAELWGKREDKYRRLAHCSLSDLEWRQLRPSSPNYFFDEGIKGKEGEKDRPLDQMFMIGSTALQTSRDEFATAHNEIDIVSRLANLRDASKPDAQPSPHFSHDRERLIERSVLI